MTWLDSKNRFLLLVTCGALVVVFLAAWVILTSLALLAALTPVSFDQVLATFTLLATVVGGAVLLTNLYFTRRAIEISREGQITDRFSKAVEQLGADNQAVKLGGIYALERIASDSQRDHGPVMEVLTAYVRENAPWNEGTPRDGPPPTDIQAILAVIGRRSRTFRKGEDRLLQLSDTDLRGAVLTDAHLEGANLADAHLEWATLFRGHLEGAILWYAHLKAANLQDAHLERAGLLGTDLQGANLRRAHLEGANLEDAHLEGAILTDGKDPSYWDATGLTREQIALAHVDGTTQLPSYLRTPDNDLG